MEQEESEMWTVKDIQEPDFGCEGLPDGEELCCDVLMMETESGEMRTVGVPDAELYEKDIRPGTLVTIENGRIMKAEG